MLGWTHLTELFVNLCLAFIRNPARCGLGINFKLCSLQQAGTALTICKRVFVAPPTESNARCTNSRFGIFKQTQIEIWATFAAPLRRIIHNRTREETGKRQEKEQSQKSRQIGLRNINRQSPWSFRTSHQQQSFSFSFPLLNYGFNSTEKASHT